MKLHTGRAILLLSVSLLVACGGGSSSGNNNNGSVGNTATAPTTYADLSGNWGFASTSSTNTSGSPDSYVGGVLTGSASSNTVTGTFHVVNVADPFGTSGCLSMYTDVPVTGSIDTSNNVKLTSSSVNGQIVNVSLVYSPQSGYGTATGTYSIAGGCAGGETGSLKGSTYNNISGSWAGSVKSNSTNLSYSVNGTITQPTTPTTDGIFTLSGSINFPNSQCFGTGTIQSSNNASVLGGGLALITITAPDAVSSGTFDTINVWALITDPSTAKNMTMNYSVSGGVCDGDAGAGTLTRP